MFLITSQKCVEFFDNFQINFIDFDEMKRFLTFNLKIEFGSVDLKKMFPKDNFLPNFGI